MSEALRDPASAGHRIGAARIRVFLIDALHAAGTSQAHAEAVADALTDASLRGIDSHGIRLLIHYAQVVRQGRINSAPHLSFTRTGPGTGRVDGDNGFGHYASLLAIDQGIRLAKETGVAAVSVVNSSHFGAAGGYVLRAALQGLIALGTCNSDSFVLPHDGVRPFHGTNPIAFAAPVKDSRPYLLDMATSSIPWNRVQDLKMKRLPLPADVSVDECGEPTTDATASAALLPLGGVLYGFKGAGLASMAEILSAVLTGMPFCSRLLPMIGPDFSTPRRLGHFFIVIDPERFVPLQFYQNAMANYLSTLRSQPARPGKKVMAPGDREWAVERERSEQGIPIPAPLWREFEHLADRLSIPRLQ